MKIDFLVASNPYNTTAHFSEHFAEALRRIGFEVRIFDISGGAFYKAFYQILEDPPHLTCSFSDITLGNKEPLGDAWEIPHLSILVDHAIYFLHQVRGQYSLVSTMDTEDLKFLADLNFKRSFLLPHAVSRDLFTKTGQEKCYDLVFLGSCVDLEEIELKWKKEKRLDFMKECTHQVLTSDISCLQLLMEANVPYKMLPKLHQELENYVKGLDRIQLIRQWKGVHIWGRGKWKKYIPHCIHHRSLPFEKGLQVMARGKIVLNSIPTLKHSFHERIFHSYALNSLPLSTDAPLVRDTFEDNYLFYRYGKWETLKENVSHLLGNQDLMNELIQNGREMILRDHTWDNRARALQNELKGFLFSSEDNFEVLSCSDSQSLAPH